MFWVTERVKRGRMSKRRRLETPGAVDDGTCECDEGRMRCCWIEVRRGGQAPKAWLSHTARLEYVIRQAPILAACCGRYDFIPMPTNRRHVNLNPSSGKGFSPSKTVSP
ncbi:conserved hypothetical protein [Coccidioides posadasii str. Silveira]|uniref:Uncharacterized protein n=2 Tax=Coccidioides posadasii TaxID=199306 RepID=E9DJ03_COCPS|nr:conserved hypothetical protein [Coccidioides posadasii str. Silveira]KMM65987.1 hypothetical protein CPAG_02327 [Coccidioides posadasii RMSCC 3488]